MPKRTPRFSITANAPPPKSRSVNPLPPDWRRRRAAVLAEEPLCRACEARGLVTAATEVDHIIPRALGGGDEREQLQPLCAPCHVEKTIADTARVRRGW